MPTRAHRALLGLIVAACLSAGVVCAQKPELIVQTGHSNVINGLAFSPDGKLLLSFGDDETFKIWDVETYRELRTVTDGLVPSNEAGRRKDCLYVSTQQDFSCWATATKSELFEYLRGSHASITKDGRLRAEGSWNGGEVTIEDASTGETKWTFRPGFGVSAVALSSNGKLLASGSSDAVIRVWDLVGGGGPHALMGHTDSVTALNFSRDGRLIAMGSGVFQGVDETDSIKIWDVSSGSLSRTLTDDFTDVYTLAFSYDGRRLASGSRDSLKLWDLETRKPPRTLANASGVNDAIVFNRTGASLFNSIDSPTTGGIRTWDIPSGEGRRYLPVRGFGVLAISKDAKLFAAVANNRKENSPLIRISDVTTGRPVAFVTLGNTFDKDKKIVFATFSPDDKQVVVAVESGKIGVWEIATGKILHTFEGEAPVAISPDGKLLATPRGNDIVVYDATSGLRYRTLKGHTNKVASLCFYGSRNLLLSGSLDTTTRVWDVTADKEPASLIAIDKNDWLVVTPDGLFDGSPAAWKQILWRFSPQLYDVLAVEAFYNDFYYPGLLTEIMAGQRPKTKGEISLESRDRRQPQIELTADTIVPINVPISSPTVTIKIELTEAPADSKHPNKGSGVQDLRLFRNGSLVKFWPGEITSGKGTVSATVPIVAGENRLTGYAFNHENIKSGDATLTVTGADSLKRKGTLHILAVGVSKYANAEYNLSYTTDDATSFATQLKLQQEKLVQENLVQKKIAGYESVGIKTLLNENATKANILAELKKLATTVQPEDAVVVYFSGHGKASGDHFYLVPHDLGYQGSRDQLSAEGLKTILAHSISDQELEEAFRDIDAGQMFMIIDACNSGQALENKDEPRRGPMNTRGLAQLAYEKGMYIMTASQNVEEAFVSERLKHSYLTFALVEEGLKTKVADADHNGEVTLREWFDYALARVPKLREETLQSKSLDEVNPTIKAAAKNQKSQTPRVFYRREAETQPLIIARP